MSEGPLSRWSKRKSAARAERKRTGRRGGAAPLAVDDDEAIATEAPAPDTEPDGEPDPGDFGLPPIESLTKDSDFTGFMAADVPQVLKRAALRKLWLSDPVLANLDGLNDYDEDYRALHTLGRTIASNYRVGRGMLGDDEVTAEAAESPDEEASEDTAVTPEVGETEAETSTAEDDEGEADAKA